MKRYFLLFLLSMLPLCVYAQHVINRNVAGLTLGNRYTVNRAQKILERKFDYFSHVDRGSSSNTIMMLGKIPFADETWNGLAIDLESTGRVSSISFAKDINADEDANTFFLDVAEKVISKYGKPVVNKLTNRTNDSGLEYLWEDNRNTQLKLRMLPDTDGTGWVIWLSYEDPGLEQKIQNDIIREL